MGSIRSVSEDESEREMLVMENRVRCHGKSISKWATLADRFSPSRIHSPETKDSPGQ